MRKYLDGLQDALLVRTLPPWHSNQGKPLVRTPKTYYRDTGLLHALWGNVSSFTDLLSHPAVGNSWEGFVIEEVLRRTAGDQHYFWRTKDGAELDLLLDGQRLLGFEVKRTDAPRLTPSMRSAMNDLTLDHLWVVYPGNRRYRLTETISALPFRELIELNSINELL